MNLWKRYNYVVHNVVSAKAETVTCIVISAAWKINTKRSRQLDGKSERGQCN